MVRLRALYFLYYAGVGVFLSYLAPYLRGLGFTGQQIGAVSTAQQLVSVPAALAWATLADRLGSPSRALRICGAGALCAACALPFVRTPLAIGATLVVFSLFASAVVPLVDAATMEAVEPAGTSYARTRLWGSLGFIVTAQGLGALLTLRGERAADAVVPVAYLVCVAGWALVSQGVSGVPRSLERPHWREAAMLLRSPRLLFWLLICAVHWGALGPYHLMFGVLVRDRGLPSSVTGTAMALGVAAEVLALFAFPWFERRLSLRALLTVAFAGTVVRWWLVGRVESAPALVALQSMHGLTFGIWWGCAVEGMARIVPAHLRATGQALFAAVVFDLGNAAGYVLAGRGYDALGSAAALFPLAAAVEVLPLALLLLPLTPSGGIGRRGGSRRSRRRMPETASRPQASPGPRGRGGRTRPPPPP